MKISENWRHLCIDMQRIFAEETPWQVPWMGRVLPQVIEVARHHSERTVFTRFIPPRSAQTAVGAWSDYYRKWWMMTGEHLPPEMLELVPELQSFAPPARIIDKMVYSPWLEGLLAQELARDQVRTLVVSGGETDVCVLSTILGAIDLGFRIVVLSDAVCSGTDETHDAAIDLLAKRFSVQLDLVETEAFLSAQG
ncbi:cysteine hydrolase family protein [Rhizobium helianthi]|uniref:Cysteine hydrolase family protein n=1 Tax=Rhizobium helianthi TaxID=1132695 RepID=A0ABW4M2H5_9HYPH